MIQLFGTDSGGEVVRLSFTSRLTSPVGATSFALFRQQIDAGDARALHKIDLELVPFFCPACDKCYCGVHWKRWDVFDDDGWHDSIRGACPEGHTRMLED
ncbi:MAG TPA: hypothetical protein VF836_01580 [Gemmatimonadaceae bacterium]